MCIAFSKRAYVPNETVADDGSNADARCGSGCRIRFEYRSCFNEARRAIPNHLQATDCASRKFIFIVDRTPVVVEEDIKNGFPWDGVAEESPDQLM